MENSLERAESCIQKKKKDASSCLQKDCETFCAVQEWSCRNEPPNLWDFVHPAKTWFVDLRLSSFEKAGNSGHRAHRHSEGGKG